MPNESGDISEAYKDAEIPAKQRDWVNDQLLSMQLGDAPSHFRVAVEALKTIQYLEGFPTTPLELLDAGCSSAYYSAIFKHMCPGVVHYTGVDYSRAMVDLAHKYYPSTPVSVGDLADLDFPVSRFDIAFTGATIIHMSQWEMAIRELARVSRKWLVLHRTNVWEKGFPTTCQRGVAYDVPVDYYIFNRGELLARCRACGFTLEQEWHTGEGVKAGAIKTFLLRKEKQDVREFGHNRWLGSGLDMLQPTGAYAARP